MINELDLVPTHFDGCAFGLKSMRKGREHMYLKKPWTVYTNCLPLRNKLSKYTCPGVTKGHLHDQCRGKNAKDSERYSDDFARCVHKAFAEHFE
jgi:hypothetical protein